MISIVHFNRTQEAVVAVEHPDGWSQKDLQAACHARGIDLADRASWYDQPGRTKMGACELGADPHEDDEEDADGAKPYRPDPVELTEDDLEDGRALLAGMTEEEPGEEGSATTTGEGGEG